MWHCIPRCHKRNKNSVWGVFCTVTCSKHSPTWHSWGNHKSLQQQPLQQSVQEFTEDCCTLNQQECWTCLPAACHMQGDYSLGALRNAMERSYSIPAKKWEGRLQHCVHCFAHKRGEGSCCQYITLLATFLFHVSDKDYIQSSDSISGPFLAILNLILYCHEWFWRKPVYHTMNLT